MSVKKEANFLSQWSCASTFLFAVLEKFKPRAFLMFKLDRSASSSIFDLFDVLTLVTCFSKVAG